MELQENGFFNRAKLKEFGMFIKTGDMAKENLKNFKGDIDDFEEKSYKKVENEIISIIANEQDRERILSLCIEYSSNVAISEYFKGMKAGAMVTTQLLMNPTSM